eukprot:gene22529-biopygen16259
MNFVVFWQASVAAPAPQAPGPRLPLVLAQARGSITPGTRIGAPSQGSVIQSLHTFTCKHHAGNHTLTPLDAYPPRLPGMGATTENSPSLFSGGCRQWPAQRVFKIISCEQGTRLWCEDDRPARRYVACGGRGGGGAAPGREGDVHFGRRIGGPLEGYAWSILAIAHIRGLGLTGQDCSTEQSQEPLRFKGLLKPLEKFYHLTPDTGAGVARAWRGRGAGYRHLLAWVARAWHGLVPWFK